MHLHFPRSAVLAGKVLLSLLMSCAARPTLWPEADALFHRDSRFLGGDAAYSVDLGHDRVLWLLGDTFVAGTGGSPRSSASMIHNSIAIENGTDPSTAAMSFSWRTESGKPASFFPEDGDTWFWPFGGVRIDGHLLILLSRETRVTGGLGFETTGSRMVRIENPDEDPATWTLGECPLPAVKFGALLSTGSLLRDGQWLYFYAVREPGNHDVFLARVSAERAGDCDFAALAWWKSGDWVRADALTGEPSIVMSDGQTEFSVSRNSGGRYVQIQSIGFGGTSIGRREAASPEGPWGAAVAIFTPPESANANALVYAAKAHPEQHGGGLAVTYVVNSTDFAALVHDESIYFPKFVKVP